MPFHPVILQLIPEDTARAATHLFGKGNIYIQLGENLNEILSDLVPMRMEIQGKRLAESNTRYAMITAIQYAEELTDNQIVEALRNRVDLKYALHLPMSYPDFDFQALCEFRQRLYGDPISRLTFQGLLDRLTEFGLFKMGNEPSLLAIQLLDAVCTSNHIERVVEAMYQALEILTMTNAEWMRQIALPHWYERYNRTKRLPFWPNGKGEWKNNLIGVGKDISYLLEQVQNSHQPEIASLREIHNLGKVWDEQNESTSDEVTSDHNFQWRQQGCTSCSNSTQSDKEVV